MKDKKNIISSVSPGSIAEEAGVEAGDSILSINGENIKDIFDYRFLTVNEELLLEVLKKNGEIWEIEVEKDEYDDLGADFEESMIDRAKSCTNKCIFCFIDQLPKNMRETLYFKDDDSRLSFLTGNYVTLTNIDYDDIERIIKYKMSPINVSVHTTNPDLRVFMLKNKFAGDIIGKIRRLISGGITINCQIVLCRYINDGAELDRTLSDLSDLFPGVNSISVVPVGITKYRQGLSKLHPFDRISSNDVVVQVENWQKELMKKHHSRIVYLADEFYLMAGLKIPDYSHYEDFPQIENGVGLLALMKYEFDEYLKDLNFEVEHKRKVSIATGVSAYKFIKNLTGILEKKYKNLQVNVFKIKNRFFGPNVTVTGLLTGKDLVDQLMGKDLGEELLICRSMLKSGETLFLDDYTVDRVEHELNVHISVVENGGIDFVNNVTGIK